LKFYFLAAVRYYAAPKIASKHIEAGKQDSNLQELYAIVFVKSTDV